MEENNIIPLPHIQSALKKPALGRIVATPKASQTIPLADIRRALKKHAGFQAYEGASLASEHEDRNGIEFLIETSADGSETTVLLQEESPHGRCWPKRHSPEAGSCGGTKPSKAAAKDTLPEAVSKAIEEILWHLWQNAVEDYIADEDELGHDEAHIFCSLVTLDGWYYGHETTPWEFVNTFYTEDDIATILAKARSFRGTEE